MPKFEIIVEETVVHEHSIIVECESEECLENLPDPDEIMQNGCDIDDYAYSDEMEKCASVISINRENDWRTQSAEITNIAPYKEEN